MPTTVPTREVYWNIQGIWIMYALVVVMTIVFVLRRRTATTGCSASGSRPTASTGRWSG